MKRYSQGNFSYSVQCSVCQTPMWSRDHRGVWNYKFLEMYICSTAGSVM